MVWQMQCLFIFLLRIPVHSMTSSQKRAREIYWELINHLIQILLGRSSSASQWNFSVSLSARNKSFNQISQEYYTHHFKNITYFSSTKPLSKWCEPKQTLLNMWFLFFSFYACVHRFVWLLSFDMCYITSCSFWSTMKLLRLLSDV